MQRDRRQPPHPFFFVFPVLILLAVWSVNYVRENNRFDAEPVELIQTSLQSLPTGLPVKETAPPFKPSRARLRLAPKSRFIEEPLPPLKPVSVLSLVTKDPPLRYIVRAMPLDFDAYNLNDKGIVVGSVVINRDIYDRQAAAAFWERGKVTRLSGNREPLCRARAINANDTIVGEIGAWSAMLSGDSGNNIAVWHTRNPDKCSDSSINIPSTQSRPGLSVERINRWGQIIGNSGAGSSIDRGTFQGLEEWYGLRSENARSADTCQLSFFRDGEKACILNTGGVYGLNDLGQVVGTEALEEKVKTTTRDGFEDYTYLPLPQRAVLYQGARISTLWEESQTAVAYAINNRQHVVGVRGDHPVKWKSGITTRLRFLPGTTCGVAQDINDRDQIVGHCGKEKSQRAAI